MKKFFLALGLFVCTAIAGAQSSGVVSYVQGSALPPVCIPSPVISFYLLSGGTYTPYYCSAQNTWSVFGSGGSGSVTNVLLDKGGAVFNVKAYGAKGTERIAESTPFNGAGHGGTMTNGSATLTCTDCNFTSSDIGLYAAVTGASSTPPYVLVSQIASVTDSSHAVLAANATSSVTNGRTGIGPDDYPAISSAMSACSTANGGVVYFPEGYYLSRSTITQASGCTIQGVGATVINNLGNGNAPDEGTFFPSGGSWIDSVGAIAITGTEVRDANLRDFGIMNCGIGLTNACIQYGSPTTAGAALAEIRRVIVHGNNTTNPTWFTGQALLSYNQEHLDTDQFFSDFVNSGANVISYESNVSWCGFNSVWTHFYTHPNGHSVANGNNAYAGIMAQSLGTGGQCNYWYIYGAQVNDTTGDGTGYNAIVTGTSGAEVNGLFWYQLDLEGPVNQGCLSLQYTKLSYFSFTECDSPYYVYHQGNNFGNQFFTLNSPNNGVFGDTNTGTVTANQYYGFWNQAGLYGISRLGTSAISPSAYMYQGTFSSTLQTLSSVAATSGQAQFSPPLQLCGTYWNGTASANDCFSFQNIVANGTNPSVNFNITHSGTPSTAFINVTGATFRVGNSQQFNVDSSGNTNIGSGIYLNPNNGVANVNEVDARTAANALVLSPPGAAGSPTSITGCSNSSVVGGKWAGQFASGTTGTCTVVITPGITASHGFSCWGNDLTTPANKITQTATSTTTATISGTTTTSDVINWGCIAY